MPASKALLLCDRIRCFYISTIFALLKSSISSPMLSAS